MSKLLHYRLNTSRTGIEVVTESKGLVYIRPLFSKDLVDICSRSVLEPVLATHDISEHRRLLGEFVSAATCINSIRNMIRMASDKEDIFGPKEALALVSGERLGHIGLHVTNTNLKRAMCIPHGMVFGIGTNGQTVISSSKVAPDVFIMELNICMMARLKDVPDELGGILRKAWDDATGSDRDEIIDSRHVHQDDYNLMGVNQVCTYLSISLTSLGRYMSGRVPKGAPEFPSADWYVGRSKRWRKSSIDRWMQARTM